MIRLAVDIWLAGLGCGLALFAWRVPVTAQVLPGKTSFERRAGSLL